MFFFELRHAAKNETHVVVTHVFLFCFECLTTGVRMAVDLYDFDESFTSQEQVFDLNLMLSLSSSTLTKPRVRISECACQAPTPRYPPMPTQPVAIAGGPA